MNELSKQLDNIILEEIKNINQKIKGTSFLESLKIALIDKINENPNDLKLKFNKINKNILKYENEQKKFEFVYLNCKSPIIFLNKKLPNNTLLICFHGNIQLDIFDFNKKNVFKKFNLKSNTGITISKDTICNINHTKDSNIIEIYAEDKVLDIEIKKESTT